MLVNVAAEKYLQCFQRSCGWVLENLWWFVHSSPTCLRWSYVVICGHLIRVCVDGLLCCRGAWRRQKADCINLSLICPARQLHRPHVLLSSATPKHTHCLLGSYCYQSGRRLNLSLAHIAVTDVILCFDVLIVCAVTPATLVTISCFVYEEVLDLRRNSLVTFYSQFRPLF